LANQQKNGLSERQLQYGSMKEPTAAKKDNVKFVTRFNEESIYDTKGDVLELKSGLFHKSVSESSEESEEVKPRKHKQTAFNPASLKYDEIGFGSYRPSNHPRYVVVKSDKQVSHDCESRRRNHHHNPRQNSNCGCADDLVVEASAVSEQSVSYENNSSQASKFST
jgi:hypothetical protein